MYIYWLGESSFKIKSNKNTIVIDPGSKTTGLSQSTIKANIALISNSLKTDLSRIKNKKTKPTFVIDSPGEYEIDGVFVYGIPGKENNILYSIKINNLNIAHLGGLKSTKSEKELEPFEGTDILMLPVGNNELLSPKQADKVINQIEPKIVIPMNYKIPKIKAERADLSEFLKEIGEKNLEPETSLNISQKKLPKEETKIVLLQC